MSCACAAAARWDDTAAARVCPVCASVLDPGIVLVDSNDSPARSFAAPKPSWHHDKDARNKKNEVTFLPNFIAQAHLSSQYVISQLIKSITASLSLPGLAPRAIHIFTQARSAGLRWGRQAKRTAAASVGLALREANHPHHLHDIAVLLNESFSALSRSFLRISSLLGFTFSPSDPSIYISSLQSQLQTLLQDSAVLSASLSEQLRPLDFRSVVNTAYSLCAALTRTEGDASRAAPSTACAIFLLALESEIRCSLHNAGDLALYLGAKYSISKGTVMSRYKIIQDQVASWIEQVPWLDKYTSNGGRAKVSRRTVVACGLKDALEFRKSQSTDGETQPTRKKRKLDHDRQKVATFLLNPMADIPFAALQTAAPNILSSPDSVGAQPLTRLQRLAQERGGSDVAHIPDAELFAEGELEAILRTSDEIQVIKPLLSFEGESTTENRPPRDKKSLGSKRKAKQRLNRVNTSAFEQFMGSNIEPGAADDDPFWGLQLMEADSENHQLDLGDEEADSDSDVDSQNPIVQTSTCSQTESEIIVEQWKPLSPYWQNDTYDTYDSDENE